MIKVQNKNIYGLHENILITLEIRAKQTGKSLDEVVAEYKKVIEEGKKEAEKINRIEKFMGMVKEMAKKTGKSTNEIIKETFKNANLELPKYSRCTANIDLEDIKKGDSLVFNMNYTKLEDGKIYLFDFYSEKFNKTGWIYGKYNKKYDYFKITNKEKGKLINSNNIKILGVLVKIQKEIDL